MTESLKAKAVKGTLWLSVTRALAQLFSWSTTIIVARILTPDDYGLMGMAGILIGVIYLFNEMGLGAAIIQRERTSTIALDSIFWFSVFLGALLYSLLWLAAPWVAFFFRTERLVSIIRVLSLSLIIGSFRIVPYNLLTRDLLFDKRSKAELAGSLVSGLTSITLAFAGAGVWALVSATLADGFILLLGVYFIVPWRPRLAFSWKELTSFLSFGSQVSGERVVWYAYSNSDYLIIGRLLGDRLLGYYTMAFELASKPIDKVAQISNSISFPLFSRLSGQPSELKKSFLRITEIIALLVFPALIGLICVAREFVDIFLTEKWLPMVFPLQLLCFVGLFKSSLSLMPNLLLARGKPNLLLQFTSICAIVLPITFVIGCLTGGINGVALAWGTVYPFLFVIILRHSLREINATWKKYFGAIQLPLLASLAMATVVSGIRLLAGAHLSKPSFLIMECGIGAAVYIVIVYIKSPWVREQFKWTVLKIQKRIAYARVPDVDC